VPSGVLKNAIRITEDADNAGPGVWAPNGLARAKHVEGGVTVNRLNGAPTFLRGATGFAWLKADQLILFNSRKMWYPQAPDQEVGERPEGHLITAAAFDPTGRFLAVRYDQKQHPTSDRQTTVVLYSGGGAAWRRTFGPAPEASIDERLAWSASGKYLAFIAPSSELVVLDQSGQSSDGRGHAGPESEPVYSFAWSPSDSTITTLSTLRRVKVQGVRATMAPRLLEGFHSDLVSVAFTASGRILLVTTADGELWAWRTDRWSEIDRAPITPGTILPHPQRATFQVVTDLGASTTYHIDEDWLLSSDVGRPMGPQYANARAVIVGDTGVGKSGLSLVLAGQPFQPTESTHGRRVWTLDEGTAVDQGGNDLVRDVLLWDLAGQPAYRVVHQLHLAESSVAIVVFDARDGQDPFSGVTHWARALHLAQQRSGRRFRRFLVEARADVGGRSADPISVRRALELNGFDDYFLTSAKNGVGIDEVREAILGAVEWGSLQHVSRTDLFQEIKEYFRRLKESTRILDTLPNLIDNFLATVEPAANAGRSAVDATLWKEARAARLGDGTTDADRVTPIGAFGEAFLTCVYQLEAQGLVRRLDFGDFLLLQPELLDFYASTIILAARSDPGGLGTLDETRVLEAEIPIHGDDRVKDARLENLLLAATVQELLAHELMLREVTDSGVLFVFPSSAHRDAPPSPARSTSTIRISLLGSVESAYATLIVRLNHTGRYRSTDLWRNAAEFKAEVGGTVFIRVTQGSGTDPGIFELSFDGDMLEHTAYDFEQFSLRHLASHAVPGGIRRERVFRCPLCDGEVPTRAVTIRLGGGEKAMTCGHCSSATISLLDGPARLEAEAKILQSASREAAGASLEERAERSRRAEVARSLVASKLAVGEFDTLLCYASSDAEQVGAVRSGLRDRGLLAWMDTHDLRPGLTLQEGLTSVLPRLRSVVVCFGVGPVGPWQSEEVEAFLRAAKGRSLPIIPVRLKGSADQSEDALPLFLQTRTSVDLEAVEPNPFDQLEWAITGKRRPPPVHRYLGERPWKPA
jgi:GTPase SAR1 family protein